MKNYLKNENDFSSIKDILKGILSDEKNSLQDKFHYNLIKNSWSDIIGNEFLDKTYPDRLVGGTLYVACSSQGAINTLHFYKKDIIKDINKLFKDDINIMNIKFFFKGY